MPTNEQRQEPVLVQALFDSSLPRLDVEPLQADLAERFGDVESVSPEEATEEGAMFALHDLPSGTIEGKPVPTTISFVAMREFASRDALVASLGQTWDWPQAREVVAAAATAYAVMPMFSWAWLDREIRLELLHAGLEALLAQTEPVALHWPQCERLVSPITYLRARGEVDDPVYPAVNVRMFRVTDGQPGEIVMDTLGLAPLGLADFEIRYVELEPATVARQLSNLALYAFEHGDVIADGHTVEGVPAGSVWRCSRSTSSLPPTRTVVELAAQTRKPRWRRR